MDRFTGDKDEFPLLYHPARNSEGLIHMDHAGATLYSETQINDCHQVLRRSLFGNPHSHGPISSSTADQLQSVRSLILCFFNAAPQSWNLIFTSGATASFKVAAESFPWDKGSKLIYAHNSHTSVLGMREIALEAGATFCCLPAEATQGLEPALRAVLSRNADKTSEQAEPLDHLLVVPAECNFHGGKLDLDSLARLPREYGGDKGHPQERITVMLDAAKLAATSPLDLSRCPADLLSLSFYKMFGYPTGLGCLLLRNSLTSRLSTRRRYFGGGSVLAALPQTPFRLLRTDLTERLTDGTENFLGILQLKAGFAQLQRLGGMQKIQHHTVRLAQILYDRLVNLRHHNGQSVCQLYSAPPTDAARQGPIVTFNLLRADGEMLGYSEVGKIMGLHNIQLRTGCFCNPGACQAAIGLSEQDVHRQVDAGHGCWDDIDVVDGRATGAVRASFGYMSSKDDIDAFMSVIHKYFVSKPPGGPVLSDGRNPQDTSDSVEPGVQPQLLLSAIVCYPVKSCAGFQVTSWPLCSTGLLFDREWALVDDKGQALRMNRVPRMRCIQPRIDLTTQLLHLSAPEMPDLQLSLSHMQPDQTELRHISVCGEACQGLTYQAKIDAWFSEFLQQPCSLVRCPHDRGPRRRVTYPGPKGTDGQADGQNITFSNSAQFLLISSASVDHLNALIAQQVKGEGLSFLYEGRMAERNFVTWENFRPNLLVQGGVAHIEDGWEAIDLISDGVSGEENLILRITGPCARCSMVNMSHRTDVLEGNMARTKAAPVLKTLASYRRDKSDIYFGQFLAYATEGEIEHRRLKVGTNIRAVTSHSIPCRKLASRFPKDHRVHQ